MNSMYFTEEHELFRQSFRDFLHKEVVPHIEKWEKTGTIERFIWEKFGEMGFFGLNYPEAYGGMGMGFVDTVLVCDYISGATGSFSTAFGAFLLSLVLWQESVWHWPAPCCMTVRFTFLMKPLPMSMWKAKIKSWKLYRIWHAKSRLFSFHTDWQT